jgi:hypothetical protein
MGEDIDGGLNMTVNEIDEDFLSNLKYYVLLLKR